MSVTSMTARQGTMAPATVVSVDIEGARPVQWTGRLGPDQSTSSAGSRFRWASNSSSVIARACSRVQIVAVSGSTATAWWTLSRSPVSAACTARVCTPMLVRLSAASWSGSAPTAVGWTPLWSIRHGTSTQASGGRLLISPVALGTLPYTTAGVPVTTALTMLAPYSTEDSSFADSFANWLSKSP